MCFDPCGFNLKEIIISFNRSGLYQPELSQTNLSDLNFTRDRDKRSHAERPPLHLNEEMV